MKHTPLTKALAVFMAILMTVTGCAVYASAECSHSSYTWKTVKEPDCKTQEDGLEQKICDECGAVLEEDVLEWEYAHDYSAQQWAKYPTCTEKGEYYEKCIYCEKLSSFVVLIPNAHEGFRNEYENGKMKVWSYSDVANWFTDTPATCTQPGLRHAICKECGVEIASESIDPLGHKSEAYEDWLNSTDDAEDYLDDIMLTSGIHSRTELAVCASRLGLF